MTQGPKSIRTKRIYEAPDNEDGVRVLVDRLWPRGISKEKAALGAWMREIAPSNELRKEFHGHPDRWNEFVSSYREELGDKTDQLKELMGLAAGKRLTLLFAAKDIEHNNAVALKQILESRPS